MSKNLVAKISLYLSTSILIISIFYQYFSENKISNNALYIVFPFFFLILALFHITTINEINDADVIQKSGFRNLKRNWEFYSRSPSLILIITVLAITYSILLKMSGVNMIGIFIIIIFSIILFTTILFIFNKKSVIVLFWFSFYFWQISFVVSILTNYKFFFIDNVNPLGSLIPFIFHLVS